MHTNTGVAMKITSTFASNYEVSSSTTLTFNKLLPNCFSFIDYCHTCYSFEEGLRGSNPVRTGHTSRCLAIRDRSTASPSRGPSMVGIAILQAGPGRFHSRFPVGVASRILSANISLVILATLPNQCS